LRPRLVEVRLGRARDRLDALGRRGLSALVRSTGPKRARLERTVGRLAPAALLARIGRCAERLEVLRGRLRRAALAQLDGKRRQLEGCGKLLSSLSYRGVLKRGFGLLRDTAGRSIRSAGAVRPGQRLEIELADGRVGARSEEVARGDGLRAPMPPRSKARVKVEGGGGQGSLF
jgi:exodeoxyribonuclease VII large subunit